MRPLLLSFPDKGVQWTIGKLRHYFEQNNINDERLWNRIAAVVILTLIAFAPDVPRTRNCFELYGFDILIDDKLKPWLLEVNLSPSLNLDTPTDHHVKKPMLRDVMLLLGLRSGEDIGMPAGGSADAAPPPPLVPLSAAAAAAAGPSSSASSRPQSARTRPGSAARGARGGKASPSSCSRSLMHLNLPRSAK